MVTYAEINGKLNGIKHNGIKHNGAIDIGS